MILDWVSLAVWLLSEQIDFSVLTHYAGLILSGEYPTEQWDKATALLIKHLKQTSLQHNAVTDRVTDADFKGKMKSLKESTSTSPSGYHLRHWKALCVWHSASGTGEPEEVVLDSQQREIRQVTLNLINYALKWGYSYERWKTIVNVMIFKDPGCYHIHRLWVIHLYEADYNFILAVKWREMIHQASDLKLLHPGQNGRVPNLNAQNPVFIEEMQNEISRASQKPLVK